MAEELKYPHERMSWAAFLKKYSRGDTFDSGHTPEQVEAFRLKLYEMCLEEFGCTFEGDDLFQLKLTLYRDNQKSYWEPLPNVRFSSDPTDYWKELEVAEYNLRVAHSEFERAWRRYNYITTENSKPTT